MLLLLDSVEKGDMKIQEDQIIPEDAEDVETLAEKVVKGKE